MPNSAISPGDAMSHSVPTSANDTVPLSIFPSSLSQKDVFNLAEELHKCTLKT